MVGQERVQVRAGHHRSILGIEKIATVFCGLNCLLFVLIAGVHLVFQQSAGPVLPRLPVRVPDVDPRGRVVRLEILDSVAFLLDDHLPLSVLLRIRPGWRGLRGKRGRGLRGGRCRVRFEFALGLHDDGVALGEERLAVFDLKHWQRHSETRAQAAKPGRIFVVAHAHIQQRHVAPGLRAFEVKGVGEPARWVLL